MTTTATHERTAVLAAEVQYSTFYIGDQLLGVDIRQVQEINRQVDTTPVPHAPEYVRGVINLRGDVVTVIDLRTVLGLGVTEIGAATCCLVLDVGGEKTALLVDRIADVVMTQAADRERAPANVAGVDARFFTGIYKLADALLVALDVDQVLSAGAAPIQP